MKCNRFLPFVVALASFALTIHGQSVIDFWDMNDNGTWQTSDNGTNFGSITSPTNHTVDQVDDDGIFILDPTQDYLGYDDSPTNTIPKTSKFGPKVSLSSVIPANSVDIISVEVSLAGVDFSYDANTNAGFSIRLWDTSQASNTWVGLKFYDGSGDKLWVDVESTGFALDLSEKTGRLVNGSAGTVSSSVVLDLDISNNKVYVSAPDQWNYTGTVDGLSQVFEYDLDFSSITQIDAIQASILNWDAGQGDYFELDAVTVSTIPETKTAALTLGIIVMGMVLLRRRRA